jgi:hypothetical protein
MRPLCAAPLKLSPKARKAGQEANKRKAAERAADYLAPVIAELQAAGATSLRAIAAALNERGIATPATGLRFR